MRPSHIIIIEAHYERNRPRVATSKYFDQSSSRMRREDKTHILFIQKKEETSMHIINKKKKDSFMVADRS